MTRHIKGIRKLTAHNLCADFPRLGIIEYHTNDDLTTLILDSSVIMKVYDDHIVLDLGGKLAFLSDIEFEAVEIR